MEKECSSLKLSKTGNMDALKTKLMKAWLEGGAKPVSPSATMATLSLIPMPHSLPFEAIAKENTPANSAPAGYQAPIRQKILFMFINLYMSIHVTDFQVIQVSCHLTSEANSGMKGQETIESLAGVLGFQW